MAPNPARAEQPAPPRPSLAEQLLADDPATARTALEQVAKLPKGSAVRHLDEFLRSGPPDALLEAGLKNLAELAHPRSLAVLEHLREHRRPKVRRLVYTALATIRRPQAKAAIVSGLRDPEGAVRRHVASLIGELRLHHAVDDLFAALDRGEFEVAAVLGTLAPEDQLERFGAFLQRAPLLPLLQGYGEFLRRRDISLEAKHAIVERLGKVSSQAIRSFLSAYLQELGGPPTTRPPRGPSAATHALRQKVHTIVRRIADPNDPRAQAAPESAGPASSPATGPEAK